MNKLTEIVDYLFAINGQHIIGTLDSIDLDLAKFWLCISPDIEYYQQYFPITKQFNIHVPFSSSATYDFTGNINNIGYDISDPFNLIMGQPPADITRCTPVGQNQMIANWAQYSRTNTFPGTPGRLIIGRTVLREYRKPKAWFTESGTFDITAYYDYFIKKTYNSEDPPVLTEVEIVGLENSKYLLDLLSARFLQLLGRTRRAFTYNDLQITTDAAELVKEGEEKYDKAVQAIENNQEWYKSVHR